jgi:hypothetical protein
MRELARELAHAHPPEPATPHQRCDPAVKLTDLQTCAVW